MASEPCAEWVGGHEVPVCLYLVSPPRPLLQAKDPVPGEGPGSDFQPSPSRCPPRCPLGSSSFWHSPPCCSWHQAPPRPLDDSPTGTFTSSFAGKGSDLRQLQKEASYLGGLKDLEGWLWAILGLRAQACGAEVLPLRRAGRQAGS